MTSREEVVITAVVRNLVDRMGRQDYTIPRDQTFKSMGFDNLDLTDLECGVETYLHKIFLIGIRPDDSIQSLVWRLQAQEGG